MKTHDCTPPKEFLQAFWRVTGKEPTARNVLEFFGTDDGTVGRKIQRAHAEIVRAKEKTPSEAEMWERRTGDECCDHDDDDDSTD